MTVPYYDELGIQIYNGDSRELTRDLPSVDLVIIDPPYSFSLQSTKNPYWADLMNNAILYEFILSESKRLTLSKQGAAWVFNSWRGLPALLKAAYTVAWQPVSCLVWDKDWIGPGGTQGLRPSYELALLFVQKDFKIHDRSIADIWKCKWSSAKPHGHPAEKPVELIKRMIDISRHDRPDFKVLDFFMGSGTTLVAAKSLGAKAIGVEMEKQWCDVTIERLAQEYIELSPGDFLL